MLESEVLILVRLVHAALLRDVHRAISSSSYVVVETDRDTARCLYASRVVLHDELVRGHVVGEASIAAEDVVPEEIATVVLVHRRSNLMPATVELRDKWIKLIFIVAEQICRWPGLHPFYFLYGQIRLLFSSCDVI